LSAPPPPPANSTPESNARRFPLSVRQLLAISAPIAALPWLWLAVVLLDRVASADRTVIDPVLLGLFAATAATSAFLGWFMVRRLARGAHALSSAATALAKEEAVEPAATGVREYDFAVANVAKASSVLRARTMDRDRAEEILAGRASELAILYQFTDRRFRAASLADVYDSGFDAIFAALHCDRASILLYDDAGTMRFAAWRGLSEGYRRAAEGYAPWAPEQRDAGPVCIDDVRAADLPVAIKAALERERVRALAFIPLIAEGRLIGTFVTYYDEPHTFTESKTGMALNIARQMSLSVERLRAEQARSSALQRNEVLIKELQHRTRNLLAVVQSIARKTAQGSADLGDFTRRFDLRLAALAQVQQLLSRSDDKPITCTELVHEQLAALAIDIDNRRVIAEGPEAALPKGSVQILALALHELATNALKYGALSAPSGRIAITWRLVDGDGNGRLSLDWRESGVEMTDAASEELGQGYGRELIEKALPYQLGAKTCFELSEAGVHCAIEIPVGRPR
jgi:two-component sensor histidine kinase